MAQQRIPKWIVNAVRNYRKRLEADGIPIERAFVYGSHAKGTARKYSDIDLCLVSPKFRDPLAAIALLLQKRNRDDVIAGIEPVGFTPKDFREGDSFINEIKRTGIIIR
jgi:predicted nucleotidyltransferase